MVVLGPSSFLLETSVLALKICNGLDEAAPQSGESSALLKSTDLNVNRTSKLPSRQHLKCLTKQRGVKWTQSTFHRYFPILSLPSFILATNSLPPHSPHPLTHALCGAFFQCCQVLAQSRSSVSPEACRAPSTHPLGQARRPFQDYPGLSWLCVQGLCSHARSQLCLCPESSAHLPLQAQIKPQHLTVVFTA